ncbi:M50 family metallopeptidase [Corynebacterium uterequi]|uniref:Zinc metalloprotease Rip1 n=1 Tax=Corynebacterium uterequi TaxID=1072256 RepID=A0A0G3HD86_9CORY|nr:M50 family metallopeptidase [Corynebacterium uterequi]AKK11346.1 putative membrane-associated Zn-dependent protease [Corynebacterium uterequi]
MGAYLLGVVLFALGIAVTIALHECGHLLAARAFSMPVRRYFIGFGPTLVSTRRGGTEYGIAAFPFGGFCEIAGMTINDPVTIDEAPHAMVRKPWWQRVVVLLGGIAMNLLLGVSILYAVAVTSGIPNPDADFTPTVGEITCTADQLPATGELATCSGVGAAGRAGIEAGDRILAIDDARLGSFAELANYVAERPGQTVTMTVERDGTRREIPVVVDEVTRYTADGEARTMGAVGVVSQPVTDAYRRFGPVEAVPAVLRYSGQVLSATVEGVVSLPAKIPGLIGAIVGQERAQDSPMSVVGASMIGGELVERSIWDGFWMMLASLNFFLALFNLVPVPPLDGGHIAVVLYEKLRDGARRLRGKAPRGPVNYEKLTPVTIGAAAVLMAFGALVLVADVVNPVSLTG